MLHFLLGAAAIAVSLFASACAKNNSTANEDSDAHPPSGPGTFDSGVSYRADKSSLRAKPAMPCPEEMSPVGTYCIDRYEAHLKVAGFRHPHNYRPPTETVYVAASEKNVFPQGYISRHESELACLMAGKRLCTLEEWLQACKGPRNLLYSYGNEDEKGRCNKAKPHLMLRLFKDEAPLLWTYENHFNNPLLNETPGFLAQSGEYYGCMNDYGIFDMVGNLHEWVSDSVDRTLPTKIHLNKRLEEKYKDNSGFGIFMGGFFSTTHEHGAGCQFITIGHEPGYHDYSTGFRCCRDANTGE